MLIGITGGIGSGKSTVLRVIAEQGYPVYDCDAQAKRIIAEDSAVRRQLTDLFGAEAYKGGTYQTQYVASQVFADPDRLGSSGSRAGYMCLGGGATFGVR